jgi:hypothetical protein
VSGEEGGAGDRGGHDEDGATRDEEAQVHRDAEAEHARAVRPQGRATLLPRHPAGFERPGRQLERDQAPGEEGAEHHGEHGADERYEPEQHDQHPRDDRPHDESGRIEARPPESGLGAGGEIAEIGFDDAPDALVEPVADDQSERGERERVQHDEPDDEGEPEADAQQVAPSLIPGFGESGEEDRHRVEVRHQQHDEHDEDAEHDRRGDETERHGPRSSPEIAEAAGEGRDAGEELGDRVRPARPRRRGGRGRGHGARLAVTTPVAAALAERLGR